MLDLLLIIRGIISIVEAKSTERSRKNDRREAPGIVAFSNRYGIYKKDESPVAIVHKVKARFAGAECSKESLFRLHV
jgi:hypothetical protein